MAKKDSQRFEKIGNKRIAPRQKNPIAIKKRFLIVTLVFSSKFDLIEAILGLTRVAEYAGGMVTNKVATKPRIIPLMMLIKGNTYTLYCSDIVKIVDCLQN